MRDTPRVCYGFTGMLNCHFCIFWTVIIISGMVQSLFVCRSVKKPFGYSVANAIVFKKLRERLGFDRCKIFFSGAAPLSRKVHEYFMSLNIPIMVTYGMSENSGPHSFTMMSYWKLGTVGKPMSGVQQKIDQPDENGDGEVCVCAVFLSMRIS